MPAVPDDNIVLLDRPVMYVEPEVVEDEPVGFEDETTEYVLAEVEDVYDDMLEVEPVEPDDDAIIPTEEIVLLEDMRVDARDLEVA